jgi:hypothetical protein
MEVWKNVRWAEARQITELMGLEEESWPDESVTPKRFFDDAVSGHRLRQAVSFLGHALPRYDGVAWAAHLLDKQSRGGTLRPRDRQALDFAMRWVDDPNDDHRRAAYEAAEAATKGSAESLLALAVFFSGGSIAPPEYQAVLPQPELSGRMASQAVLSAGHRTPSADAFFAEAVALGDQVASEGTEALAGA